MWGGGACVSPFLADDVKVIPHLHFVELAGHEGAGRVPLAVGRAGGEEPLVRCFELWEWDGGDGIDG